MESPGRLQDPGVDGPVSLVQVVVLLGNVMGHSGPAACGPSPRERCTRPPGCAPHQGSIGAGPPEGPLLAACPVSIAGGRRFASRKGSLQGTATQALGSPPGSDQPLRAAEGRQGGTGGERRGFTPTQEKAREAAVARKPAGSAGPAAPGTEASAGPSRRRAEPLPAADALVPPAGGPVPATAGIGPGAEPRADRGPQVARGAEPNERRTSRRGRRRRAPASPAPGRQHTQPSSGPGLPPGTDPSGPGRTADGSARAGSRGTGSGRSGPGRAPHLTRAAHPGSTGPAKAGRDRWG